MCIGDGENFHNGILSLIEGFYIVLGVKQMSTASQIRQLADILVSRNYVITFTGAGISTDSGISDFRGSENSLWNRVDPAIFSARTLRSNPATFFRHYREIIALLNGKLPNPGHLAVAQLSKLRIVKAVITQNIDGLHQQAGSRRVFEIHGNTRHCQCRACQKQYPHTLIEQLLENQDVPLSPCCGAVLRPGIVLFDDKMGPDFLRAREEAWRADFALIAGTSLTVFPAAEIPMSVGQFAIINQEKTLFDEQAVLVIRSPVSDVLTRLVQMLRTMEY
jgi:NAD-dependent deacetylase